LTKKPFVSVTLDQQKFKATRRLEKTKQKTYFHSLFVADAKITLF